jgi:carbamoyltransferase
MNLEYFDYLGGADDEPPVPISSAGPRVASPSSPRGDGLARSVQEACEIAMLRMAPAAGSRERRTSAGGRRGPQLRGQRENPPRRSSTRIWVQPASSDSGGAAGAALVAWHHVFDQPRTPDPQRDGMKGSYLGPEFSTEEIEKFLRSKEVAFRSLSTDEMVGETAALLAQGNVIGWFQGRMEFGPRALGSRSILGDPRDRTMQSRMNIKIKKREGFRPFAPSVVFDRVSDYFELDVDSPYMLLVAPVRKDRCIPMTEDQKSLWGIDQLNIPRSDIPAVTHVDYSARVQTVRREDHPLYYDLLRRFERERGARSSSTRASTSAGAIVCAEDLPVLRDDRHDYLVRGTASSTRSRCRGVPRDRRRPAKQFD